MPEYRHPRASDDVGGHPPARVHVSRAETVSVDADGRFEAPERVGRAVAQTHDLTESDIRVNAEDANPTPDAACSRCGQSHDDGACWDLIDAGECPWCDEYEGDHVGQHASSAHPEEWATYQDSED